MAPDIPESDWRHFREVRPKLLEEFARRSLAEIVATIEAKEGTAHARYLKVYKLIHKRDKDLTCAFSDYSRSSAVTSLGIMRRMNLLTDEDLSRFSELTRTQILNIASL